MNRQEAIDRLKNEVKRIEEIMKNGDCGCVDMDTWNEFAKKAEWRETLIELLTGPQPDPITGLVPCGCGGKAKVWPSDPTQFTKVITDYEAGCTECAMTTGWVRGKQENAVKVWNTAMSGGMCNHEN